ncbi:MAG TPA: glycosyltransferase family 4 protein, partial [Thermomicrobiales bacterium]
MSDLVLGRIQRLADAMARQPDASPDAVAPPTQPTIGQPAAPKADARSENGGKRLGLVEQIETAAKTEGLQAAEDVIAKHEAYLWSKLSQVAEPLDPAQSLTYAERAFERAPQASQASYARRVARLAHDVRDALPDDRVMQALLASGDAADVALAARLLNDGRVWRELAAAGFPMPKRRETPAFLPIPGKVLYCLHNSLPHDSGGYATRSHGVLQSVNRAGFSLVAYTRLGYPWDLARQAAKWRDFDGPAEDVIDGIVYRRLPTRTEGRRQLPIDRYLARYAEEFEAVVRRERPEILHAASAYLVGVPTAAVARRLGIPFVYEVRGLWEVTHVSRDPAWAESDQYAAYVRLETQAAQAADAVLTLTNGLKQELVRRGVPEQKIAVVPNSVDTDRFVALEPDRELARRLGVEGKRIVGYVGSFVDYEGLDDLLHAAAVVIDRGVDVRLLLVGDGAESSRLRDLVADLELTEHVIMPGRVPFEDVQRYYSLVDVAVFPRKPWPVTEMVSP